MVVHPATSREKFWPLSEKVTPCTFYMPYILYTFIYYQNAYLFYSFSFLFMFPEQSGDSHTDAEAMEVCLSRWVWELFHQFLRLSSTASSHSKEISFLSGGRKKLIFLLSAVQIKSLLEMTQPCMNSHMAFCPDLQLQCYVSAMKWVWITSLRKQRWRPDWLPKRDPSSVALLEWKDD